jgi:hypothetical protein
MTTNEQIQKQNEAACVSVALHEKPCTCEDEMPYCESCTAKAQLRYEMGEFDPEVEEEEDDDCDNCGEIGFACVCWGGGESVF